MLYSGLTESAHKECKPQVYIPGQHFSHILHLEILHEKNLTCNLPNTAFLLTNFTLLYRLDLEFPFK